MALSGSSEYLCYGSTAIINILSSDQILTICDDVKRIESNLLIDTKNALEWCKANDMVLSLPKCCSMIVASRQRLQNVDSTIELKIDDTVIPWVTTTKILGVHFDNALSWDVHIKHVYNKMFKNL